MDAVHRNPLLDLFRRGEAPRDVRLLAARGGLAPAPHDQLALLVLLTGDQDPEIAGAAEATLAAIPKPALSGFLTRPEVSEDIRGFFGARGVEPVPGAGTDETLPTAPHSEDGEVAAETGTQKLGGLPVPARIKIAMRGTREQRAVLIRDPNKLVALAVLSSPKVTDSEVEAFARMANVSDEVLRVIGTTRGWLKNYPVVAALVRNPKTPPAISLQLVQRLNDRDVKMLAIDRNVPEALRLAARKVIIKGQARRQ